MLTTLDLIVLQIFANWLELDRHIGTARANGHRLMLVLAIDLDQAHGYAQQVQQAIGKCLWVNFPSASHGYSISASQAPQVLGSNHLGVIYNAHDEFNASAFCALVGTIDAGGVMVLLTPPLPQWELTYDQQLMAYGQPEQGCRSWFKHWWVNQWQGQAAVYLYAPQAGIADVCIESLASKPVDQALFGNLVITPSQQQQQVIDRLVSGHSSQEAMVYCLDAARGRGKSSCLGWVIDAMYQSLPKASVIVTAPSKRALASMHKTAAGAPIVFWAVDALLAQLPQASMLIIDEAAAVPLSQLARLAAHYKLLVLASTQDGYEGSGQGYRLKLPRLLQQLKLDTTYLNLVEPMRWRDQDPLEHLLARSFLDYKPVPSQALSTLGLANVEHQQVSAKQLAQAPELLHQVYNLLRWAHYQTSPQDLRQLLDHGTTQLHVWCCDTTVVGVVWLSLEGGFDQALAHQVEMGRRRLSGHLLAQILAQQAGFGEAACLCSWRVQRIAVLPNVQHLGLGSVMLQQIRLLAQQQGIDYLGASFAADGPLIEFWNKSHYQAVWLGLTADAATGLNSIQFMLPLSAQADRLLANLRSHLAGYLGFGKAVWFEHLQAQPWFTALNQTLAELPPLGPQQQTRLLQLLAHGVGNVYWGLYILQPLLSAAHEQQILIKTKDQSKKAYQKQVRELALKRVL